MCRKSLFRSPAVAGSHSIVFIHNVLQKDHCADNACGRTGRSFKHNILIAKALRLSSAVHNDLMPDYLTLSLGKAAHNRAVTRFLLLRNMLQMNMLSARIIAIRRIVAQNQLSLSIGDRVPLV
jgi:hypothetical protein